MAFHWPEKALLGVLGAGKYAIPFGVIRSLKIQHFGFSGK
jgi:hypothetical protein